MSDAASPLLAAVVLVALPLAGCLASTPQGAQGTLEADADAIPDDWDRRVLAEGDDHDHHDPAQHQNLSTANFEVIGYDPLVTDHHGRTGGGHACGATDSDGDRQISVVHSFGSDVGFVVIDTTDPENPKKIGELVMPNANVYDVDTGPDLQYVVLGTSVFDSGPDETGDLGAEGPTWTFRDACTGQERRVEGANHLPLGSGLVLVDLSDPTAPEVVDYRPMPVLGAHSVRFQQVGDRKLILATTTNVEHGASYYVFLEPTETPAGPVLETLSVYQDTSADAVGRSGPHDAYMQVHPVTETPLAYLAHGGSGMVVLDISDPTMPEKLGQWRDMDALGDAAPSGLFIHEALPMAETWDGRHVTFIGEECGGAPADTPTCLVMSLDTTDPANPELLGVWNLPEPVQWRESLQWSTHYIEVVDRTLFVSLYHGGVWAVDVSTPEALAEMPSIGAFVPARESPEPVGPGQRSFVAQYFFGDTALDNTPSVLEANAGESGELIVYDSMSGVYTVRFDADRPAPKKMPLLP